MTEAAVEAPRAGSSLGRARLRVSAAFWRHKWLVLLVLLIPPVADCGNGSKDCKDYNEWQKAWTEVTG